MLIINSLALKTQAKNAVLVSFDAFTYGAAREFIGAILNAKGKLESAYSRFL